MYVITMVVGGIKYYHVKSESVHSWTSTKLLATKYGVIGVYLKSYELKSRYSNFKIERA